MSVPVQLLPMFCIRCQMPVPAKPDETAWVCSQCGQGMLLSDEKGLVELEVNYAASNVPNHPGRPFWVAQAEVTLARRTYQGDESRAMAAFWQVPRSFFIPAFALPVEELTRLGATLLQQPPVLNSGPAVPFQPVTVLPEDIQPLAEFIVLEIEAARQDKLRELNFTLKFSNPSLWILP
jgi:hypothetical protein